jgi:electron transport complex protein RnfC
MSVMKHYKGQTEKLVITRIKDPEYVYIPMSQHIGAPAKTLVAKGDLVKVGQLIGSADAFVTANVHSSVSGQVEEIIKMKNAMGLQVETIKIKNDFQNTVDPTVSGKGDLDKLTPDNLRDIVREAGLVGMGGATFPTHVKFSPPEDKKVDTVILNAAECEPYLTADHRLLLEEAVDVLYGLKAIAKAVDAKEVCIGIEDNKLDAVETLKQAGAEDFCKIKILKTAYPTGAEKVLVKKVIGRKVPNKGIPLDVGVVVSNVGTAYQLAKTIKTGMPLIERVVTVSGEFTNPGNYLVKIGTLLQDFAEMPQADSAAAEAENADAPSKKIIVGGPMMGFAVNDLNIPVTKGTSGVLYIPAQVRAETQCIRCGKCVDACPLGLLPYQDRGMDECMECGLCTYGCPANIFIVQKTKLYKQLLRAQAAAK